MRKIILLFFLNSIVLSVAMGQTLRTGVLVVGNQPGAYAAAIQSARSGAKTLLLSEQLLWRNDKKIAIKPELNFGILAELSKKSLMLSDSSEIQLQAITDTLKGLNREKATVRNLKKIGKGWEVRLSNGKKVKTDILLLGDGEKELLQQLKISLHSTEIIHPLKDKVLARTSIAALDSVQVLPLKSLVVEKESRLVLLPTLNSANAAFAAGQAAGATAAFCAFFETDTKNLNTRMIQGELLNYRSSLFPFGDSLPTDSDFVRLQHVALSGLLQHGLTQKDHLLYFNQEGKLSTEELKDDMKSFYSRSQIWFADHTSTQLNLEEAISLFMYTATRGEEIRREIERNWKTGFGFKSDFQPKRAITRKEFAALADAYLQPFSVKIDLDGQLIN